MSNVEEWRVCAADTGYEVSSLGRVRSVTRALSVGAVQRAGAYTRTIKGRVLVTAVAHGTGYSTVSISTAAAGGRTRQRLVHRLVAGAFLPNPHNFPQVNHINGVRLDNRVENLEWVTAAENQAHSYTHLGRKGTNFGGGKTYMFEGRERTIGDIARERGLPAARIHNRLADGWSIEDAVLIPPKRKDPRADTPVPIGSSVGETAGVPVSRT